MRKILAGIIIVFLFCGCAAEKNGKVIVENEAKQEMQYEYGENMTVTRALAAKMVCLLFLEQKKCKENHFYDVDENMWFYDYANLLYENSIMVGSEGYFSPLEPLKYIEAMKTIKRLGGRDVEYENKKGDEAVSYDLWLEMIEELAEDKKVMAELKELNVISVGDGNEVELMKAVTDGGVFDYSGLWMENCVGRTIKAYVKNENIIAVKSVE